MNLTHKDVQDILKIIDESEHLDELELVYGDFRLHVRRHGVEGWIPDPLVGRPAAQATPVHRSAASPSPAADSAAPPPSAPAEQLTVPEGMVAVRAPMLGTFYRSPSPGEPPFVEVGQKVKADDTVCLIEVMKLFNSIKAGVDGTIVQIGPENATLVEYEQVLILIRPSDE
jgi:acetyl-CoA carboxylase biotin carboxyl carrier protein